MRRTARNDVAKPVPIAALRRLRAQVRRIVRRDVYQGRPPAQFSCRVSPLSNEVVCRIDDAAIIAYDAWSRIQLAICAADERAVVRIVGHDGPTQSARGRARQRKRAGLVHVRGMRIEAHTFQTTPDHTPTGAQRRRHERVYKALARVLGRFGRNDADPARGDFWIVDDFGSGTTKKVYVWRIEIYTRAVAEAVRSMLRRKFPEFDVMLVMDIVGARDLLEGGVRVRPTTVATRWNARLLRKRFGKSFAW